MFYAIAVVLVLIADQALKYWVSLNIELNVGEQALIPGVIKLVNIHNSGAAFGLLSGGSWRWVFVVIAVVFTVVVIYALKRDLIHGKLGRWAAVGVLAGSIGNCIDRVAYGYVVDMFKFEFLGDSRLNAIFNVADVFISCCGVLFCLYIIFGGENSLAAAGEEDGEPAPKRRSGSHSKHAVPVSASAQHTAAKAPARRPLGGAHAHSREGVHAPPGRDASGAPRGADKAHRPEEPLRRVGDPGRQAGGGSSRTAAASPGRKARGGATGPSGTGRKAHAQGGAEVLVRGHGVLA
ncbi:MAG: signal peptidase II [Oscillospiraceae bacterium]